MKNPEEIMLHIDENRIYSILAGAKNTSSVQIESILRKSLELKRLTLQESAALLSVEDDNLLTKIFNAAAYVKDKIYGKRVVLFAPLYISNYCVNNCLYCAFRSENSSIDRKALNIDEIKEQTLWLLRHGHKRILLVAGESAPPGTKEIDYYIEAIDAIYSVEHEGHRIKRVNINCAPLTEDEFKRLKASGIGTFQIFQETYHSQTYKAMHLSGPKSDPDNRIDAVDRAFRAGIDDVGIGVLYGLNDYKFETLAMLMHVEHLEKTFNVGPHTISVPRIEPASGSDISTDIPSPISDDQFKKIVAVLRLSVPYTGIILSTRENAALRDELFDLGISQVSAASSTSPGGYGADEEDGQFSVGDTRSLDEVISSIIDHGFIPSFCAACYRSDRTGEKFMSMAKPGTIKGKCGMNALITLKEYLDDFASQDVKAQGYKLIDAEKGKLDTASINALGKFYEHIDHGKRDEYV